MPDFPTEPPIEIARRLEIRGADSASWIAVLSPLEDPEVSLPNLEADVGSLLQKNARVMDLRTSSYDELRAALHSPADDIIVFLVRAKLGPEKWASLDLMRSALERPGPIIFWIPFDVFGELVECAPNIRSFIGPSIFALGAEGGVMSESERVSRINQLSQHYGFEGTELIRRAESGELSLGPTFVEWLVLLGRGDLV